MKYLSFFICLCLGSWHTLHAREALLEARGAYYYPLSDTYRSIYPGTGIYNVELSVQAYKYTYLWINVGGTYAGGSSIGCCDPTTVYTIPLEFGLKWFAPHIYHIRPYLGVGIIAAYAHIHNDFLTVVRNQSDYNAGAVVKSGCLIDLYRGFFLDLFIDYSYLTMDFCKDNIQVGLRRPADFSGISLGGGLGYSF